MNLNLSILTALLQKLDQPYSIEDNTLIIEPTSTDILECLPGEWDCMSGPSIKLRLDITTFDVIDYMATTVKSLSQTI